MTRGILIIYGLRYGFSPRYHGLRPTLHYHFHYPRIFWNKLLSSLDKLLALFRFVTNLPGLIWSYIDICHIIYDWPYVLPTPNILIIASFQLYNTSLLSKLFWNLTFQVWILVTKVKKYFQIIEIKLLWINNYV